VLPSFNFFFKIISGEAAANLRSRIDMVGKESTKEGFLVTKRHQKIVYSSFIPAKTTMQLVVVHGFSEHMRCYYDVAEALKAKGVAVHLFDLPGHGLSEGPRGHIAKFQQYADAVDLLLTNSPHFLKTKPTFLFGHSLGGLVATQYCLQKNPKVSGLILSSPLMGFPIIRSLPVFLLTKYLIKKQPAYQIPKPRNVKVLCRNPAKWEEYASDPFRLQTITPSLYQAMVTATRRLQRQIQNLTHPLLVFFSAKDQVVSPVAIQRAFATAGSRDKTLIALTEAMHELLQEEERPLILDNMLSWMKERI
jgi:alpha-beta hydrolase superfamily lysophospholipase